MAYSVGLRKLHGAGRCGKGIAHGRRFVNILKESTMQDMLREPVELIDQDLDRVSGGHRKSENIHINIHAKDLGIGQLNIDSVAVANTNVGAGTVTA